jgi:hypothetical protein
VAKAAPSCHSLLSNPFDSYNQADYHQVSLCLHLVLFTMSRAVIPEDNFTRKRIMQVEHFEQIIDLNPGHG